LDAKVSLSPLEHPVDEVSSLSIQINYG
jgi:hypothetical protein